LAGVIAIRPDAQWNGEVPSPQRNDLAPILVIDDDEDDCFLCARRIKQSGIQNPVEFFEDGDAAAKFLDNQPPEKKPRLVFMDLKFPGPDGLEVLASLRRHPGLSDAKFIILSGSNRPFDRGRAAEAGVDGYLVKFPGSDEFKFIIANACREG
jgi:CheY-like chemotaxis protein